MFCVAASQRLVAASKVTYTASGTFAAAPAIGKDLFKLAGEPFSISVVASEASVPYKHGAKWASYNKLPMQGTVQSGLIPTPTTISSNATVIELATGNPSYDVLAIFAPVKILSMQINFTAIIQAPKGTIPKAYPIQPFTAPVTLTATTATVTYADTTDSTTLAVATGSVTTTVSSAATAQAPAGVMLHAAGAQAVTVHEDGTQTVRPIHGALVETGSSADTVVLRFYASGVRDASEVHVQIGGEEARVLYAGASGHFAGLDQVSVEVPRSLAWKGDADVVLSVDGRTSNPLHIQIR
jgi:uncharacterized protein (TIGR03437 family)